ncbi:hypothetical protein [Burkholderia anthina]|uniref:hypothetical protein n=1 Tax=Burkholderia anthina TaxID=179879 RepID=UPI0037C01352
MISGPFVLRKTKAAQSAPVQVQPAQPVQPAQVQREVAHSGHGLSSGTSSVVLGLVGVLLMIPYIVGLTCLMYSTHDFVGGLLALLLFGGCPVALLSYTLE